MDRKMKQKIKTFKSRKNKRKNLKAIKNIIYDGRCRDLKI